MFVRWHICWYWALVDMGKLSFNVVVRAIEFSPCNDAIKHIVDRLDYYFRAGECDLTQDDWPKLSSLVARKKRYRRRRF